MTEQMFSCSCGFKSVEGQLAKTNGACPRCGLRTESNKLKYDKVSAKVEQTTENKKSRGEL